ncbi:MAG: nucleotidyltransferase, partial [Gemmatimonadota bacterium]
LDTNRALLDRLAAGERGGGANGRPDRHVTIIQPVLIGPDCVLENAVIGPYVSLSRGASVRDAVIRDSIVGERASVEGLVLERSIIGPDASVRGRPQALNVGDGSDLTC